MREPDNSLDAEMVGIAGSTGSGKTTWLIQQLAARRRVLVFDAKNEYRAHVHEGFDRIGDLAGKVRRCKSGRFRFVPSDRADLERFCAVAWAWGNCTVVIEESAAFTHPGKASPHYHRCLTQGRGYGIRMYVVTQRPAESDKTIWGNASLVWCGRLSRAADRKTMADELDLQRLELDRLGKLEFITRDMATREIERGKVRIPRMPDR